MNYFELFELPAAFAVDQEELARRYRELQRSVHPDKFASATEQQRLLALHKSAQINDGFQTLKSDLARAKHLMELHGAPLAGEQTFTNPEFLMQQMELREELELLRHSQDPEEIDSYERRIDHSIKGYFNKIGEGFDHTEHPSLDWLAEQIREVKFLLKIKDELERLEDALFEF